MDMQTNGMEAYVKTFNDLKEQVGDVAVAIAILHEAGKDRRCALIEGKQHRNSSNKSNGPATSQQLAYLKVLGVQAPGNISRAEASTLIDQALATRN